MSSTLLGHYTFEQKNLEIFESCLKDYHSEDHFFQSIVNKILSIKEPIFLLPALLHVFSKVNSLEYLHMNFFEFWLNLFSNVTLEEQLAIRGKIVGKYLPREAYQLLFPIGMNKYYFGSHFVCAHLSPDLDTTVASFLGWIDAFGAKIGLAQHIWSLPGGPSDDSIIQLFEKIWGKGLFQSIARPDPTLTLSAIDLTTRKGIKEVKGKTSLIAIDSILQDQAIIMVDENGDFLGDWDSKDAEVVRPPIFLFKSLLKNFESLFYIRILRFFADPMANLAKCTQLYHETFSMLLIDCEHDYLEEDRKNLNIFLKNILHLSKGLNATFKDLGDAFYLIERKKFHSFHTLVKSIINTSLFDSEGNLIENRPEIFHTIENLIHSLDQAIHECNQFAELLSTAVELKFFLNPHSTQFLTLKSTIEEIRTKMENQDYLPVLVNDKIRKPLGIIPRNILSRMPLGTVSLRDFSNFEEVNMASYLNVISVIDHHKSALQTMTPPQIIVGDVQSCNTLIAEQLFAINDQFRREGKEHFIHYSREIAEYFSCLYAIIDDTDFLSKVSSRDIDCIGMLLNRLKLLIHNKSCLDLSDIPRNLHFCKVGAERILKTPDMFSIYDKIIESRQNKTKASLEHLNDYGFDFLCSDTKEQNGCARIGQTKLFPDNFPLFEHKKNLFCVHWYTKAKQIYESQKSLSLHLQMISTIPSSQDLFSGKAQQYNHLDELWFWIPQSSTHSENLLATFLNAFLDSPKIKDKVVKIEVFDDENDRLKKIFEQNFLPIPTKSILKGKESYAVLYIVAGSLNSRKSMLSPYLPKKVS